MKRILLLLIISSLTAVSGLACTSFLVGKDASTDGSVFISYNVDSYGRFGKLIYLPHKKHPKGAMRKIIDGDTHHYHGDIPEASETYAVTGYINEYQLSIMETTFGGREELVDTTAIIDYPSLMHLGLQRAKTAREAIQVMTSLVEKYGYVSEGESFSIADPNEIWILEMIGKGPGVRGANWVAVRIPDNAIACHANHSRIRKFLQYKDTEVLYSKGIIDFARSRGYFNGKDADFDFSAAFAPADFGAIRYCETRVWSFYNRFIDGMDAYLDYADGHHIDTAEPIPLWFIPKQKLSLKDVFAAMRDHYEGTPFDVTKDCGMGLGEMPYRPTPLEFEYNGKKYFNERPISTQQTADTFIAQLRSWLPDAVGGILWYGQDEPNMIAYVPVFCQNTRVPVCFDAPNADGVHFSWDSAFWVCNWVANMTYPRYNIIFPAVLATRNEIEDNIFATLPSIEKRALAARNNSADEMREILTRYTEETAANMLESWKKLGELIIVDFNDMTIRKKKDGKYLMTPDGLPQPPIRPGFSNESKRVLIEQTGDKYLIPKL